jgi:cytochrome P450
VYSRIYRYRKQGVPVHTFVIPFFGSFLSIVAYLAQTKSTKYPLVGWSQYTYVTKQNRKIPPPLTMFVMARETVLVVNDPQALEELMLTKNKYFDKHPFTKTFLKNILGDSILFAQSDLKWQSKRKVISSAVYKDKLRGMFEIMK